jgi:chemotaxis protein CheC
VAPLDELELDALKELFNIGSGRSAKALSTMVSQPVELTIPEVHVLPSHAAIEKLKSKNLGLISAVSQKFKGDFNGHALLMFNRESGLVLVRKLLQDSVPLDDLSELEQDSLLEVGNIMLNSCFGTVINHLNSDIEVEMPRFEQGTINSIYSHTIKNDWSLYIELQLSLPEENIVGHISFVMGIQSQQKFQSGVKDYITGIHRVAASK